MQGLADQCRNQSPIFSVAVWDAIEVSPERKLFASVIGSAIKDLYAPLSKKMGVRNARQAAKLWLFGDGEEAEAPLLFTDCCEALDLCPDEMRTAIRRLKRKDLAFLARRVKVL